MEDSLFWRFEPVSGAADGPQIPGMFRIKLNLAAQFSHVDVHGARADEGGLTPDGVEDLVAREYPAGMLGEIVQQAELCGRSGDDRAAYRERHCHRVNCQVSRADQA